MTALLNHEQDLAALRRAVDILENPSLTAHITHQIGRPIEALVGSLPKRWSDRIVAVSEKSMTQALEFAVDTLDVEDRAPARNGWHTVSAVASGAFGGAAGFAGLAVELPVSTTLMLRSIADIARSEGEDLADLENRMHCLMVFALGSPQVGDNAVETGYFAVRYALARAVSEAAKHIATYGVATGPTAPGIVHLIRLISARFGVVLSQKAAAQMVPLMGAIGGAGVNYAFMEHFQRVATGHFTVRRLERAYGDKAVRKLYDEIKLELE